MARIKIQQVNPKRLRKMLCQHVPRGCFLAKEIGKWVAVDNSTGDAWTEEFSRKHQAVRWLRGKFEVGDRTTQRASMTIMKNG